MVISWMMAEEREQSRQPMSWVVGERCPKREGWEAPYTWKASCELKLASLLTKLLLMRYGL